MPDGRSPEPSPEDAILVRGARQNNLRDVHVSFPKGKLTVVTGVSGSGKSSLCFQTLYAEGQRRYVESFSTYARQFLERMDRPEVQQIDGLLPAVAIEQRNSIRSARSTLGSLTELNDHLKLLFKALATLECPECGRVVKPDLPGAVAQELVKDAEGRKLVICFPFHAGEGVDAEVALRFLAGQGYRRVLVDGRVVDIDSLDPDAHPGRLQVVIDRLVVAAEERPRLVEALEMAYRMGEDRATLHLVSEDGVFTPREVHRDLRCCGVRHPHPREGHFNYNSPLGACPICNGFGRVMDIDMHRVVPNRRLSIAGGAIKVWTHKRRSWERRKLRELCAAREIPLDVPWEELSEDAQSLILEGEPGKPGYHWQHAWPGLRGWFKHLERKTYKMHVRVLLARHRAYIPCDDCGSTRFRPEVLLWRLGGLNIAALLSQPVHQVRAWLSGLEQDPTSEALAPVFDQLDHRLDFLERVGLGYLTLDRQGRTLSGGEIQRANLTTAIGSGLVNTLFVLDEPTIGLHPRDTERLAGLLAELTRRDNTVVLVEHDPDMLRVADHVIDLGPGPGRDGGQVVYAGAPSGLKDVEASATHRALRSRAGLREASDRDVTAEPGLVIRGARARNLKNVDAHIPYGRLTALTGVSGSGKSTLMGEVLHRAICRLRGRVTDAPGDHDRIDGLEAIGDVVWVDQASPASSPRSNPATYVKAWDVIRKRFSGQPLARKRGYTAGTFSFNAGKGRCPGCDGAGFERVEMQFLSDVYLTCQVCDGKRFKPEVLEVTWEDRSIADMLELTVDEAMALLDPGTAGWRRLKLLADVGLAYLKLGQPLATLSGGESQRLKIAHHLGLAKTTGGLFLLDEPTTGLHLDDVDRLIANLHALVAAGNTVLVVEHHLDVVAAADHVIELGPDGGDAGGQLIYAGPPASLASRGDTPTGEHLARWLAGIAPLRDAPADEGVAETRALYGSAAHLPAAPGTIELRGARVHNLKAVAADLPRRGRTVISGVSGSGKSSLAFDLIFAEGQRRFLDCLSSYARQYISQLGRPDADRIAGIPPTVAIEQRTTRGGSRSMVANVTEIEPYLRLLFARLGAKEGDRGPIAPAVFAAEVARAFPSQEVLVRGPVVSARKGYHKPILDRAVRLGHVEILVDGELKPPSPRPRLRRNTLHTIAYILGRVEVSERATLVRRIEDAVLLTQGPVEVGPEGGDVLRAEVTIEEAVVRRRTWDPRLFSHHTEVGACRRCGGHGHVEQVACGACDGTGLGPEGRAIRFGDRSLPELLAMTPQGLVSFLQALTLDPRSEAIAKGPIRAIVERAMFLVEVGLGYLTLNRRVRSLSGGEAQRIRLAAQLGAHLSGVLYVLDEPTIGLHPTDTDRLLATLDRLQSRGNGVLMVEHDEATLRSADVLVDMGPGAGVEGGEILVQGPLEEVLADPRSVTGRCLQEGMEVVRAKPRPLKGVEHVRLQGMGHHNLRGANVRIPRGRLTVVTGVSGSGKSSLVDVLRAAVSGADLEGWCRKATGLTGLKRFVEVDDKPIGKNPRSTPATYVGVWDTIRRLFAKLPEARLRGYGPGRFSFNVKGGRCEACGGQGVIKLEMSFLPDAYSPCEVCLGRRWNNQTLHIRYDGHTIHDVLQMPVRDALTLFDRVPRVKRALSLLTDVGLGYLELGQASPTLSGGEAQRIKLARELLGRERADTVVVLDEPSVGLHMADVPPLLRVMHRLVDAGATVVVIEHHPDVMREADWIVDMGPGPGEEGGRVVYEGGFKGLKSADGSRTGAWLAAHHG